MKFPLHLSVIPDGNRTRSQAHGVSVFEGYLKSVEKGVELIKYVFTQTGVKVLSGRGMSTENRQKRPIAELEFLFNMYQTCGDLLNDFLTEQRINFRRIGDASGLPAHFLEYMSDMVRKFTFDTDRTLIFAVNYGGQNEIIRGIKSYLNDDSSHQTLVQKIDNLNEETLGSYMDLGGYPPVELVIRTKGDFSSRISGFMSRRIGYAELFFEKKLFQDVLIEDIQGALNRFDSVIGHRNFGG
ncbi:MAG TPA: polyprenyl diphosphate synthase [Candidatus Absconditabacterales bacterium]|nr:polyprenyl diphosphate synthase [Candidatus Absconditabacterales bacterium]HNG96960.1 polyprenyl diphosphate synthase [Candidatus Absconditabacterales bacterium]